MRKVKCDACGQEVKEQDTSVIFVNKKAVRLCTACYYRKLSSIGTSEICEAMGRRNHGTD